MAVNKVVMNTENGEDVLIDLTGDSVTPQTLAEGATAHDASGNKIVGTMPVSILLDDESNAEDITNAINAYKTYGTNVLFTINGVDFSSLVAITERPQKVLYFITAYQDMYRVAVESDNTISYEYIEIVNRSNVVHTVATATQMNTIIANATEKDIGNSYLYCGETTANYKHGVIYIIGEEDVNG